MYRAALLLRLLSKQPVISFILIAPETAASAFINQELQADCPHLSRTALQMQQKKTSQHNAQSL